MRPVRPGFLKNLFPLGGAAGDPYFANVVLQAGNENGAEGGTSFVDQSSYARALTAVGHAQWDTGVTPPAGLTSTVREDGTGDCLTAADAAELEIAGDFNFGMYVNTTSLASFPSFFTKRATTSVFAPFQVYLAASGAVGLQLSTSGAAWAVNTASAGSKISVNTWHWVCLLRSGSTYSLGVDGTEILTGTLSGALFNNTGALVIGAAAADGSFSLNGNWASARFTVGVARDLAVPTLPLPTS